MRRMPSDYDTSQYLLDRADLQEIVTKMVLELAAHLI
jgi:hypothetical protein